MQIVFTCGRGLRFTTVALSRVPWAASKRVYARLSSVDATVKGPTAKDDWQKVLPLNTEANHHHSHALSLLFHPLLPTSLQ